MRKNPETSTATIFDTTGATGLEQIMSSVAEMTLPEINRKIKTFISQQLDIWLKVAKSRLIQSQQIYQNDVLWTNIINLMQVLHMYVYMIYRV